MKKFLALSAIVGLVAIGVGVGRHLPPQSAVVVAEVTATTVTTGPPVTTTSAVPSPLKAAVTPTTVRRVVATTATTPTTRAVTTTTVAAAKWCSAQALISPVTKGMSETVLITSNLPGRVTKVMGQTVTTDPGGTVAVAFPAPGGQLTATMGQILPKTNTVKVTFYEGPAPSLDQLLDGPLPPVLATCSAKFISVGP